MRHILLTPLLALCLISTVIAADPVTIIAFGDSTTAVRSTIKHVYADRLASLLGHFTAEDQQIAWRAIAEVGLQEQVHQRADTLSGGQQQRVAIARVVAQQPEVILADEPEEMMDTIPIQKQWPICTRIWRCQNPICLILKFLNPIQTF